MNKAILILSALFFFYSQASGQKAPVKFGDVTIEELRMDTYPEDTSASAVILCDYGHFNSTSFLFTRIQRIKILKKEGYDWANSGYPYNIDTQIKGITFNLENGKITKEYLKSESIFKDKITENICIMRIAMPNVKVGSVIDLEFSFKGIMPIWRFQDLIPVKYSELEMEDTKEVKFKYNFFGYQPLYISTPVRWVAKNMPSFKVEPFMTSKENYLTRLEFDILNIDNHPVTTSWEELSRLLMEVPSFGLSLSSSAYLNKIARSIEDLNLSREEMIKKAFEAIQSVVKWNEKESLFASTGTLGFAYRMKIGNSADVNLILLQLLKKLGFDATPVIMSTRSHGFISPSSPSIERLNYIIVQVKTGGKSFLLDATEPHMPYYLIPFRCLNYTGILMDETSSTPLTISTDYKDKKFTTYNLRLLDNNTLEGKLILKKVDYSALDFRKKYQTFSGLDEYLEDFKKDKQGLRISGSGISNIDSIYLPVIEDYSVTINDQLTENGNEIYIFPMFYHQMRENPLRANERKYPVDYGYRIEETITSSIEIPENYEVVQLPAPLSLKMPENAASLTYITSRSGNTVNVKSVFSINKPMFLFTEYKNLKEFYNEVIKKHSEPIIIKKI